MKPRSRNSTEFDPPSARKSPGRKASAKGSKTRDGDKVVYPFAQQTQRPQ